MSSPGFALAVPLTNSALLSARPRLHSDLGTLRADEPRVWLGGGMPVIDMGSRGIVIGTLFSRPDGAACRSIVSDREVDEDAQSMARRLLDRCWGAYIAVLTDPDERGTSVLVDPSGLLPVYSVTTENHVVISSNVRVLERCTHVHLRVDWKDVHAFLCRPELRSRATCLKGVREVPPGSLTTIFGRSISEKLLWRPDAFMPVAPHPSFGDAANQLRETAIAVIGAWERSLGPVTVAASGGVDSSFICGALHCGGAAFSCVTAATADPSGDERPAVRRLAEHLDVPLAEGIYDPALFDPLESASGALPRPSRKSFLNGVDRLFAKAADDLGAVTIMDGNGGDNLFCYLHSAAPIDDRLRAEFTLSGWASTFLDSCRVTGCDVPEMATAIWRRMTRPAGFPPWPADERLLSRPAPDFESAEPVAPWTRVPVGPHGGKHDHLALIMRCQNHLHGLISPMSRFSPLMSQPLMELCLAIPTWLWCEGGLNRSVARRAFADALPPSILTRTAKAGPDSYIRAIFDRNRQAVRHSLMDGLLARQGLLDLPAVEQALGIDAYTGDSIIYRLLDLAEAEHWARAWQD